MATKEELTTKEQTELSKIGYTGGKTQTDIRKFLSDRGWFHENLLLTGVNDFWLTETDQPIKSLKEILNRELK